MINKESNVMNDVLLLGLHPCRLIVIAPNHGWVSEYINRFLLICLVNSQEKPEIRRIV